MDASVTVTVRLTLREVATKVAEELGIIATFEGADLKGDTLVISYAQEPRNFEPTLDATKISKTSARQRTTRKGWEVVARIKNRKGQSVAIYRPLVDAVAAGGTQDEIRKRVRDLLKANGNNPTEASVNYYFANARDYLEQKEVVTP